MYCVINYQIYPHKANELSVEQITCLVNGTSMVHPLADRKLCGSHNPFVARFPACNRVLLNFSSDYTLKETGFTLRYRMGDYGKWQ